MTHQIRLSPPMMTSFPHLPSSLFQTGSPPWKYDEWIESFHRNQAGAPERKARAIFLVPFNLFFPLPQVKHAKRWGSIFNLGQNHPQATWPKTIFMGCKILHSFATARERERERDRTRRMAYNLKLLIKFLYPGEIENLRGATRTWGWGSGALGGRRGVLCARGTHILARGWSFLVLLEELWGKIIIATM